MRTSRRRPTGWGLVWALALLTTTAPGCRDHPGRDILLITIDTLRADHLEMYGYERTTSPNLSRIFADGMVFERAYSTTSYTSASMASVLTGQSPQRHGVRLLDQIFPRDAELVSEMLPAHYQSAAFVSTIALSERATGISDRFDHFDDTLEKSKGFERSAALTTDAALQWLRHGRDATRALFLWVHYLDPHAPYSPPDPYHQHFRYEEPSHRRLSRRAIADHVWNDEADDPLFYVDRYDEEITYVDAEIGRLLSGYAESRLLDDALVVVTADHGESLLERLPWFAHGLTVFEETIRVPLLIRGPGVRSGRRTDLVSGIDVAPTILAFAGVPVPPGIRGIDLLDPARIDPNRIIFAESGHLGGGQARAAIRGDRKWVVQIGADRTIRSRKLFDLATDPLERSPIRWRQKAKPAQRLLELARTDPDPAGLPADPERGTGWEVRAELLRRLGYAE